MKTFLFILLVAIVALAAGLGLQASRQPPPPEPLALSFAFPDVSGDMQAISQWQGKILVINFWATWCPPCLKEIPAFIEWQREFQNRNVQFVGIAIDEQTAVAEYLKTQAVNYPMLVAGDAGSQLAQTLGNIINAVPFTLIVDSAGRIVHRQPGELNRQQFLQVIQPLLAVENN